MIDEEFLKTENVTSGSDGDVSYLIVCKVCGSLILLCFRGVLDLPASHQFLITANLFPILAVDVQHPETLSVFLAQMLVVHLVCPADRAYVCVPAPGKPLEALMDDHIMYHKIGKPIRHDPETDGLHPPDAVLASEHDQQHAGYGKYDKKRIVLFEKTRFHLVMIPVQIPEESMHHPLVCGPGDALHEEEGQQQNGDEIDSYHNW